MFPVAQSTTLHLHVHVHDDDHDHAYDNVEDVIVSGAPAITSKPESAPASRVHDGPGRAAPDPSTSSD
jgi:hypothetical protein